MLYYNCVTCVSVSLHKILVLLNLIILYNYICF
nr:MAG TPA: hypothetical protein [Caudoviricetes sp.]